MILNQVEDVLKSIIAAGLFGMLIVFVVWVKRYFDKQQRTKLNEITLANSKLIIEKKNASLTDDDLRAKLDAELKSSKP